MLFVQADKQALVAGRSSQLAEAPRGEMSKLDEEMMGFFKKLPNSCFATTYAGNEALVLSPHPNGLMVYGVPRKFFKSKMEF